MSVRVIRVLEYEYADLLLANEDMQRWSTKSRPEWHGGKQQMRTVGVTFSHSDGPWLKQQATPTPDLIWSPTRWWRALDSEGDLWCESSNEAEVRASMQEGHTLWRHWQSAPLEEWRKVT
jgi:uncharacterized protein involved in copper resistance